MKHLDALYLLIAAALFWMVAILTIFLTQTPYNLVFQISSCGAVLLTIGFAAHIILGRTAWGKKVLGYPQTSDILTAMQHGNPSTRANAAAMLEFSEDERTKEAMLHALEDPDSAVRESAALALYNQEGEQPLLGAFHRAGPGVQKNLTDILINLGISLDVLLGHAVFASDPDVRSGAVEAILARGPATSPRLLQILQRGRNRQRVEAAYVLGEAGRPEAVEPLVRALKDRNWEVRFEAAGALGRLGDTMAVPPLIERLNDDNEAIRGYAAWALGELGDSRALLALRHMKLHDLGRNAEERPLKDVAAEALVRIEERQE
ncbi:MAG TPA: HEAT repeat domain-containing protein [Chloroflexia bacterium]|nr:HEAT repeat domain-containing protein [Chloroflexia bacterium]